MNRLQERKAVKAHTSMIALLVLVGLLVVSSVSASARPAAQSARIVSYAQKEAAAETQSNLKIGVVFSQQTEESGRQSTHPGSNLGQVAIEEREQLVYDMLSEKGYSVDKVADKDLRDPHALAKYSVVVFPYTFMMDEKQDVAVRDYVKAGGGIVMLFAASRVYPPFNLWIRYFEHIAWEWGPLSEVYQIQFINDPFDSGFTASSKTSKHPIITGTKSALDKNSIALADSQAAAVEYTKALAGNVNTNVVPIMWYKDGTAAVWTGNYGYGKYVYFTFKVMDFWWHARFQSQAPVAKELVCQSINWAGMPNKKPVNVDIRAVTAGKISFTRSGLLIRHYHKGIGNIQAMGDITTSVFDEKGKLIDKQVRQRTGAMPGVTLYWSRSVKVKKQKGVKYRVVITYEDRYKRYAHTEAATIAYGQSSVTTKAVK